MYYERKGKKIKTIKKKRRLISRLRIRKTHTRGRKNKDTYTNEKKKKKKTKTKEVQIIRKQTTIEEDE